MILMNQIKMGWLSLFVQKWKVICHWNEKKEYDVLLRFFFPILTTKSQILKENNIFLQLILLLNSNTYYSNTYNFIIILLQFIHCSFFKVLLKSYLYYNSNHSITILLSSYFVFKIFFIIIHCNNNILQI